MLLHRGMYKFLKIVYLLTVSEKIEIRKGPDNHCSIKTVLCYRPEHLLLSSLQFNFTSVRDPQLPSSLLGNN